MTQLTVRGFDRALERRLRAYARRHDISLNRAAIRLMRRGAGLEPVGEPATVVGDALDRFIGTWSTSEENAVMTAVSAFEDIDSGLWR